VSQTSLNGYDIERDADSAVITSMTSPVYEVDMSKSEIIEKSETCSNRHLSVDSVMTSGGSDPLFGPSEAETVQSGSVVQQVTPDRGVLVAKGRTQYKHALLSHYAESTVWIEAKEDRFRVTHENIRSIQQNTGYSQQGGFDKVRQRWGVGWESALTALQNMGEDVSDCIQAESSGDW